MVNIRAGLSIFILTFIFMFNLTGNVNGFPKIKASVNLKETSIGNPVEYNISIASKDKKFKVILPESKVYIPPVDKKEEEMTEQEKLSRNVPLYIIESPQKQDNSTEDLIYQSLKLKVIYYRTGKFSLPSIDIKDFENNIIGYKIPEINVIPANKNGAFIDVEPPMTLGGNYNRLIWIIMATLLVGAIITLVVLYVRKIIKKRREQLPAPVPAIVTFYENMTKIKKKNHLEKGDIEQFVVDLSYAFRLFISSTMKFDALEMTDDEVIIAFRKKVNKKEGKRLKEEIDKIMSFWNLTKFAEFTPSNEILLKNFENCKAFVEKLWEEVNNGRI